MGLNVKQNQDLGADAPRKKRKMPILPSSTPPGRTGARSGLHGAAADPFPLGAAGLSRSPARLPGLKGKIAKARGWLIFPSPVSRQAGKIPFHPLNFYPYSFVPSAGASSVRSSCAEASSFSDSPGSGLRVGLLQLFRSGSLHQLLKLGAAHLFIDKQELGYLMELIHVLV